MAAVQRVVEEVVDTCRQQTLLALRRSILPATPIRSTRKSDLIAAEVASIQRDFADGARHALVLIEGARLHSPSWPEVLAARFDSSRRQPGHPL